ncbi:MAG: hypothetical protein WBC70_01920 [Candidatus Aminicenantales bacterium]
MFSTATIIKERSPLKKALAVPVILAVTLLPGLVIELSPLIVGRFTPQVHGLFNQYVGTIVHSRPRMSPAEVRAEQESIDSAFGEGVFRELVRRHPGGYMPNGWRSGAI